MWPYSKSLALAGALFSVLLTGCGSGGESPQSPSPVTSSAPVASSSVVASSSSISSDSSSEVAVSSAANLSSSVATSSSALSCEGVQPAALSRDGLTIEAEDFDECSAHITELDGPMGDSDYRQSDVDLYTDANLASGVYVGRMQAGEALNYSFTPADEGFYKITLSAKAANSANVSVATIAGIEALSIASQSFTPVTARLYIKGGQQVLTLTVTGGELALDNINFEYDEPTPSAADLVAAMGVGINLGNTLDVPRGEDWGAAAESPAFFTAIKTNGFDHVRIPVTWDGYTAATAPFAIEQAWLSRVEQAIDWALAEGLIVIVNAHHERWLKVNYTATKQARIEAIWQQVATQLQNKPQRLIFEILNEPEGMTVEQVNSLNPKILTIMRATNPNRAVVFSGNGFTPYTSLLATDVLAGDNLIGNFHSYDPWPFAGQCIRGWGSESDKAALRAIYQAVANWSAMHNIPATVNEFGAAQYDWENPQNICDVDDRKAYLKYHVTLQREFGIAGTLWDDDGSFRIYDRRNNSWGDALESLQ